MMAMASVFESKSDIMGWQILGLQISELIEFVDVLFVVQGVFDVQQRMVVLQKAEKNFVLFVLDRIVADIEVDQMLVVWLSKDAG